MNTKKRILILAANPKNTTRLRLDEEVREIVEGIKRSKYSEMFVVHQTWATQLKDLRRAMLDYNPHIVHFCGHGEQKGLVFENAQGDAVVIEGKPLSNFFSLFRSELECVILNACYSESQAKQINKHIQYVVGMKQSIADTTAIEFSVGFYDALGAGKNIEDAFKFGCNAIELFSIPEYLYPVLKKKSSETIKATSKKNNGQTNTKEFEFQGENDKSELWSPEIIEIVQHGLSLLQKKDYKHNHRLAYLFIDDAIELGTKTYLSLPRRVTGFTLRKDTLSKAFDDFILIMNVLEEYAPEKLSGIDVEEIEWFHRLRNQLYYQGNVAFIKKWKIEIYADLAKLLYRNLFNIDINKHDEEITGKYLILWQQYEQVARQLISYNYSLSHNHISKPISTNRVLQELGFIDISTKGLLDDLSNLRNIIAQGTNPPPKITTEEVGAITSVIKNLENQLLNAKINLKFSFSVDIVLCIDSSNSMHRFIDTVKQNAIRFYDDIYNSMKRTGKPLDVLRVKIIEFGKSNDIRESSFFSLPLEMSNFVQFVESISTSKKDSEGINNGIDALILAAKSNWTKTGTRKRHLILIWTDTGIENGLETDNNRNTHKNNFSVTGTSNIGEFDTLWFTSMEPTSKRLILFAPDVMPWKYFSALDMVIHYPAKAGDGLSDQDYQAILTAISNSI